MKVYGYVRVSSDLQNCANQHYEIEQFCQKNNLVVDEWIEEVISTRKPLKDRKLGKLLPKLDKDSLLVASEISRIGRNIFEVMTILQQCFEKGCQVWTIKEPYKLGSDIQSKVLAFAFSLAAEIERNMISQRTKECLKRLKDEGEHLGRPFGFCYKKLHKKHNKIKELLDKKVPKAQIAKVMGCSWTTLHRYIKEFMK